MGWKQFFDQLEKYFPNVGFHISTVWRIVPGDFPGSCPPVVAIVVPDVWIILQLVVEATGI